LAFDSSGNLYAANYGNGTISKISSSGNVTQFASGLNFIYGLVFDSSGNLYASEYVNDTVSKITPNGTITPFASGLDGPYGLAFHNGNFYAANYAGGSVSEITSTGAVSPFASGLVGPTSLAVQVPEPSSIALISLFGFAILRRQRRQNQIVASAEIVTAELLR
jgi:DNA-binding beta-propeller fold protein YncE